MASSTGTYCDICQNRHISKAAEEYCPVCEEALCTDCKDHHKLAKASKSHQVISIDEYNKLPVFIREIKQHCDKHGDRFEFFCPTHNELCCKRCITTTHNECKECKVIEDFVDFSKSSAAIDEYEQTLKDVEENIETAIADRKNNVEEFEKQTQAISKQIKNKRIEINQHFDNLEATIMKELFTIKSEKKQNVQSVIEKLQENKNKNIQLREDVEAMKKYGSNIQVYMGTTKLQQPVSSQEKFVRSLQDDESLRFVNLECSISEELNGITTRIRSFGTVTPTISSTTRAQFNWKSDKSAQILKTPTDMNSINNIHTRLICKIAVKTYNTITSCLVGKYVMFSNTKSSIANGCLLQYDINGNYLKEIELKLSLAFDIVFIDFDTVAVTGGCSLFNVYIVDVATLQVKRVINVGKPNWIYGATYKNESIIGCIHGNSMKMFNIANSKDVTTQILPFKTKNTNGTYIDSDDNSFYHSDNTDGAVTCYGLKGNIMWSFKDVVLKEPRSLCLDSNSNVYVAGSGSKNVVVISSDGLNSKQLLGPDDGIRCPHAIHYDKSSNRLLVANKYGPAFLYQVSL